MKENGGKFISIMNFSCYILLSVEDIPQDFSLQLPSLKAKIKKKYARDKRAKACNRTKQSLYLWQM
jgi:hypothetical protein